MVPLHLQPDHWVSALGWHVHIRFPLSRLAALWMAAWLRCSRSKFRRITCGCRTWSQILRGLLFLIPQLQRNKASNMGLGIRVQESGGDSDWLDCHWAFGAVYHCTAICVRVDLHVCVNSGAAHLAVKRR